MATLAEELLNDFDDSGDEDETENGWRPDEDNDLDDNGTTHNAADVADGTEVLLQDEDMDYAEEEQDVRTDTDNLEDEEDTKAKVEKMQLGSVSDVRNVAGLMKTLQPVLEVRPFPLHCMRSIVHRRREAVLTHDAVLQKIKHYQAIPDARRTTGVGSIEDDPEYKLLTQANSLATQIDSEIILVHKFIRDHYSTRFPQLETLVSNPLAYAKTVAILKNGPLDNINKIANSTDNAVGASLRSVLDGPTLMVVNLSGVESKGEEMDDADLQATLRACEMTLQLDRAKIILTQYVQSRMDIFAPNLTNLIGSLTAAQLLNFAGGIKGLAKTPDRNVPAMGSKKQRQSGMATNIGIRQQGFLYHSDIIQEIPSDLRIQGMRIVSAKLVLAARVDSTHGSRDGLMGMQLRDDCQRRLDKLMEKAPNRGPKALPAPDDKPARKRGGRKARKAKEATAMTDLRKQQNKMAFGKEEREVGFGDDTVGLGMMGQQGDGRIRGAQVDKRTMAKLSKKNPGWGGSGLQSSLNTGGASTSLRAFGTGGNATTLRAQGLRSSGFGGGAGTASSIAFTPVQGLELVDPKVQAELKRKRDAENAGYFSSGTFTQVGGGSNGGFKVPGLPVDKKAKTTMAPPPKPK